MHTRRQFLVQSSVLGLAGGVLPLAAMRTLAVSPPRNEFGAANTAEEVTVGIDLTGKTALITGCNAGIGYETLRVLVLRGAHVYGLARNLEKAEQACLTVSGRDVKGKATPFECEQTEFASVAACAEAVQKLGTPIDMLICNAGVYGLPKLELAEGLEKQFVVNHLSHFLLVHRLLDRVKSAPQGRVVVVGSDAYKNAPEAGIEFDNLSGQRYYDTDKSYGQSKLANGLFVRELAHRLSGTQVTANVVHPGWVWTEGMRRYFERNSIDPAQGKGAKTPAQGAATTCYVATNPAFRKISGQYFEDCNEAIPGGHMRDDALADKLWTVSEVLTRPYLMSG
jgi:NAD(P)-dependent dehydrogenase (short-subunit alcohol dehydrogenase family)